MTTRTDILLFLETRLPDPLAGWVSFSGHTPIELPRDYRLFDLLGRSETDTLVDERGLPTDLSAGARRHLEIDSDGLNLKSWISFDELTAVLMNRKSPPVPYAALYAAALEFRKAGYGVRFVYAFD